MKKKEMAVARINNDERMVIRMENLGDSYRVEYLTPKMERSRSRYDGKVFYNEEDAKSYFIIKKMRKGEDTTDTTSKQVEEPHGEKQSWSEL